MGFVMRWFREVPTQWWLKPLHYLGKSNVYVSSEWVDAYKRGLHGSR